ncbi:uncharacterized protein F5891DRAFT_981248 [Suillus fuscotomentosus]|uniref:Uncharacterized protein n=1 Tax=Suillus fuscotomentosus TaxID=1912939 RepID=A0AAD4HIS2_9AGAM|nr:uncharacterized protein F5891DRAFT_981248 [Suillus fuscotomentosus]KAG1899160.1 hypothetical protein F5891DRAFT_981248 [Suillus fuscotomentosus]
MKSIPDACANEIKKLRGVAGDIFDLPSKYFTNTSYDRANVPEIQQLFGVTSSTNLAYKTFPPVLFPELKEDRSLKTVFRNWQLLVQVTLGSIAWAAVLAIFLLSPDTEFSSAGIVKRSTISYKNLFFTYKKVLVTKWKTKCIVQIVSNINNYIFKAARPLALDSAVHEDFMDVIDHALAVLNMESSDDGSETAADITGPGTPTATAALDRHVNESISQPSLSTQRQHTTETLPGPIVDNVATNDGTAADLEDAATPHVVGAAAISSSGKVLQEVANDPSSTRGRSKKLKNRGRKAATPAMASDRTTRQTHK